MGAITSRKPSVDAAIKAEMEPLNHWFKEGEAAFKYGSTECPYAGPLCKFERHSWWDGWHSAEVGRNLAGVFKRYRIVWP